MYINITRTNSDYKNITLIKSDYNNIMLIVPTTHATGTEVTPYIQVQQILHMVKTTTPTPTLANATIVMPDKETEVLTPCLSKVMGKDKSGWYGRIAEFVYDGKIYSGQIMFYEKK